MSAKSLTAHKEECLLGERIAAHERLFKKWDASWRSVAEFYGFEHAHPSLIEQYRSFASLEKAGLLEERHPISVAAEGGGEAVLRFSQVLSLARAYATHEMKNWHHPVRLFAEGPSFFSKGRGADQSPMSVEERGLLVVGEEGASAETIVIQVLWKTLEDMGAPLEKAHVALNAIGCASCRARFRASFLTYLRMRNNRLCKGCRQEIKSAPTRVLQCAEEQCASIASHAPRMLDFLCESCRRHLRNALEFLDEMSIPYILNTRLFREGSWYNFIVFEIGFSGADAPYADIQFPRTAILAEGGGMSRAGEFVVGHRIEAFSGVLFPEVVYALFFGQEPPVAHNEEPHVVFACLGELARKKSLHIAEMLRQNAIATIFSFGQESIKTQLKAGELAHGNIALILGQKEALDGTIIAREAHSGVQETIPQEKLIEFLKKKLKK